MFHVKQNKIFTLEYFLSQLIYLIYFKYIVLHLCMMNKFLINHHLLYLVLELRFQEDYFSFTDIVWFICHIIYQHLDLLYITE